MAHDLAHFERRAAELRQRIAGAREQFRITLEALQHELREAEAHAKQLASQLDTEQILLAEHVMEIRGTYARAGSDRAEQREAAIADLLAGAPRLRTCYMATKSYAQWHGQAVDCTYGMGPRHGTVIFAIELTPPVRDRLKSGGSLTPDEVNAAVYYLRNLEAIEQTVQEADKAARSVTGLSS